MTTEAAYKYPSADDVKSRNAIIVELYNGGMTAPQIAKDMGLAETTIRHIIANSRKHKRGA